MKYCIVFLIVVSIVSCKSKSKKEFDFTFETKTEQSETANLKLSLSYPVFQDEYVDGIINKELKKLQAAFKKDIGEEVISENWKNEQSVGVECFYTESGYLSLLIRNYIFSGGAHGNTQLKSLVLHPVSKQVFGLKDFFKGEYFKTLQTNTRSRLKEELGFDAFIDEGTETVVDFSVFTLSNHEITFYFPPYQVAAYSYGTFNVSFAFSDFQNFNEPM